MVLHKISEVLDGLLIQKNFVSKFISEHGDRHTPRDIIRDAPVVEVIKFFDYVDIVSIYVLINSLLLPFFSLNFFVVLLYLLRIFHIQLRSEPRGGQLLEALHL